MSVIVLLVISAGAAYLLGRMLWPFVAAITTAVVLAVLARPGYLRLRRWVRNENLAAFLGTTLLFFLVFIPVVALSIALFNSIQTNVDTVLDRAGELVAPGGAFRRWLDRMAALLGVGEAGLVQTMGEQTRQLGSYVASRTVGIVSGLGGGLIQAGVALFTLFYMLRDGDVLAKSVQRLLPVDEDLVEQLVHRSGEIIFATVYGSVVVAMAQGTLGGITFWVLGLPGAVLWGTVMVFLSLLPALGPPLIWVPTAAILVMEGEYLRAAILVAVGALIVGTVDNLLRAFLVSGRAELHPLVVFFSVLGGLLLFGLAGIFIGPILFVASMSILEAVRLVLDIDGSGGTPA